MEQEIWCEATAYLKKVDPVLGRVIEQCSQCSLKKENNYFQALCESIISQQLAAKAAASICQRFIHYFSGQLTPQKISQSSPEELRGLGLSRPKVAYLQDLAQCCLEGKVNLDQMDVLTDQEVVRELTQVKGIGQWTAEIFLIFAMGKMDILPAGDLGIKKAIQNHYGLNELPSPEEVKEKGQCWKPYSTVAALYLWKSLHNV